MGKIKYFLAIFAILNFTNLQIFSQEQSVQSESVQNSPREEENRFQSLFDSNQTENSDSTSEAAFSSSSGIWVFVKMIFFLVIVIGLIYLILWFFKRNTKNKNQDDPFLRAVSSITLAPGKTVQIVTFMNKAFIVGVGDDSINLIKEIDGNENEANKEMINAMNLYSDKQNRVTKPKSFNDILQIFMPNGKRDKKDLFENITKSTSDFVKKQQDRMNNLDEEGTENE